MAVKFYCPECDNKVKAKDNQVGKTIDCPLCQKPIKVPYESVEEDEDQQALRARRKAGRAVRDQLAGQLGQVALGLLFHYAGVVVYLVSLWLFFIALAALLVGATQPDLRDTPAVRDLGRFGLGGAVGAVVLAIGCEVVTGALCLKVPLRTPYWVLRAHLLVRALTLLACGWYFFSADGLVPALTVFAGALGTWVLWLVFLQTLAAGVRQPILAGAVWPAAGRLLLNLLICFLLVLAVAQVAAVAVTAPALGVRIGVPLGAAAGALVLWLVYYYFSGESFPVAVLHPTGVLSVIRYLDMIATFRLTLTRRVL